MFNKYSILLLLILLPWLVVPLMAEETDIHNHSTEKKASESDSVMTHADHEDHTGHDHAEHDEEVKHDDQDGHDHADHNEEAEHDDHDGHDHSRGHDEEVDQDDHTGHDHADHEDELTIQLSEEAVRLAGISISDVTKGQIGSTVELPGEIGYNEDRLVHIAPRFAGIALKANCRVGDYVELGQIMATIESNESLNAYSIKSPISGWVIERHVTPGEFVSEENSIFLIADLSTVWVNLAVYPKDIDRIKKGQTARINAVGSDRLARGTIEFITPIMDLRTRSSIARITLSNTDNKWRPGTFVQAVITTTSGQESLMVEKNAVQFLDEESVVFIVDGDNSFKPVEVVTGESDSKFIKILGGLTDEMKYVSEGAFELKAKIVTSNMDPHAGHGH